MAYAQYHYNVYDLTVNKYIIHDGTGDEVLSEIGLPKDKLSTYTREGYIFKGIYQISRQQISKIKPPREEPKQLTPEDKKLMEQWEKMRTALAVLLDGGRFVIARKHGKIIRYVEAKR